MSWFFFFFNDTATTEIYTLSLHDALPISKYAWCTGLPSGLRAAKANPLAMSNVPRSARWPLSVAKQIAKVWRSEEHTSELQSRQYLVCRLLLEKKRTKYLRGAASFRSDKN